LKRTGGEARLPVIEIGNDAKAQVPIIESTSIKHWGQEAMVSPMEPHETMPQGKTEPPRPLPSFVFIDLRDDPEAWVQIENELAEDVSFPAH
jgi:hypothetical protein